MSSNSILEPLEAGLTPRIFDDVHAPRGHVCINECHPLSNLKPRWCNCRAILTIRQTFKKHPCRPFVTHLNLESLVEADVYRLAKTCAATRNMDNFNAHFLDRLHNRRHHVTAVPGQKAKKKRHTDSQDLIDQLFTPKDTEKSNLETVVGGLVDSLKSSPRKKKKDREEQLNRLINGYEQSAKNKKELGLPYDHLLKKIEELEDERDAL